MKIISCTILFLLFNIGVCLSQNATLISGNIRDRDAGIPIEFANIALLKDDSTFLEGAVSDTTGYFAFSFGPKLNDGNYILQITHLNYNKKYQNIRLPNILKHLIYLYPTSTSLSEVEVVGLQTKVRNKLNIEYKVTDQLRESSLRTSQLLENIPTVFVDYNQNVYIKGSSRILILKNGLELPSNSLIDQIPPSTIQRVEVMHSIPSKYVNRNYTSVMNIITKRESNMALLVDNNSSFDGQMYDAKVNLSLDTKKHSAYAFYKLYYRNFLEKYSIRNSSDLSQSDVTSFFKTKPRKESDNEFFYGYSYQPNKKITFGVDGYLSLYRENFNSVFDDAASTKYADFKESFNTQNYKGYMNYQDSLNKFQGIITYNHIKVNDDFTYYSDNNREENQDEKKGTYNIQLDYKRKLNQHISLATGVEFAYVKHSASFYIITPQSRKSENFDGNNISGYVESTFEFNDRWNLEAGFNLHNYARMFKDGIETKSFNFYPKLNVSYSANDENSLRLSYSSYINNPSLWQMLSSTKEDSPGVFYKGNPYLKPEKHSTLSLEYSYSKGNFYYANSIYLKDVRDKIQSVICSYNNQSLISYTNLNKRFDYGLDLTLSWGLADWWKLNVFMDFMYRDIPDNKYYKNRLFSYSGQVQSSWSLSSKLSIMAQYMHNSKELVYNGYSKSYNSSLVVVSYKLLDDLRVYLLAIEPFARFESYSAIYNSDGFIERRNNIKVRTFLVSFTYSIFKNKNQTKKKVYYNEEKKY